MKLRDVLHLVPDSMLTEHSRWIMQHDTFTLDYALSWACVDGLRDVCLLVGYPTDWVMDYWTWWEPCRSVYAVREWKATYVVPGVVKCIEKLLCDHSITIKNGTYGTG